MTWADLEQKIDASDLTRRNRTVLKAFSTHVNPPTEARPYPSNCIIWPSMPTLMDVTRYSLDTIQRAKRDLVKQGILEPVDQQGPWRRHSPRYYINEQKIHCDEAAQERQIARRARRLKGRHPPVVDPEKGTQNPHPFQEKGRQNPDPLPAKGSVKCPPEVSSSTKDPEDFHFSRVAEDHTKKAVRAQSDEHTPLTFTSAPATFPLTDELRAWAALHTPHVANLAYERDRWLQRCRAKHYVFLDWAEEFKSWLIEADYRARQHGQQSTATTVSSQPEASYRRITCSFAGCSEPPCPHSQACRGHACCRACAAERAADTAIAEALAAEEVALAETESQAEVAVAMATPEPAGESVSDANADLGGRPKELAREAAVVEVMGQPESPTAAGPPVAMVEALAQAFARSHTMPQVRGSPPVAPLGGAPARRRVDPGLGDDGEALEQDVDYLARMRARKAELRAQAAQLQREETERRTPVDALVAD